jgi:hypothetical protein
MYVYWHALLPVSSRLTQSSISQIICISHIHIDYQLRGFAHKKGRLICFCHLLVGCFRYVRPLLASWIVLPNIKNGVWKLFIRTIIWTILYLINLWAFGQTSSTKFNGLLRIWYSDWLIMIEHQTLMQSFYNMFWLKKFRFSDVWL